MDPVADYLALEPDRFPWLIRLHLSEEEGRIGLELEFRDESSGRLVVVCDGVRNLEFRQPWTTDMRFHSLDVTDERGRQMEDVGFSVADLEQEWLSFTSATFRASAQS